MSVNIQVVERDYNGMNFKFREGGYFNMTHAAKRFNKRMDNFWVTVGSKECQAEFSKSLNLSDLELVQGNRGRYCATGAHPKLAVFFARWRDVKFAVFCDMVINDLIHGYFVLIVVNPEMATAHALPQTCLESLQHLIDAIKEQDRLKLVLGEKETLLIKQAPKVEFHDTVTNAENCHDVGEAAKILGWSRNNLSGASAHNHSLADAVLATSYVLPWSIWHYAVPVNNRHKTKELLALDYILCVLHT